MSDATPNETDEPSAWRKAERAGFDMSVIEANLEFSIQERMRAHGRALAMACALREAMENRDASAGL